MLFKGKQITCQIIYQTEKYSLDLDRHKTVNDLYIAFQDKINDKETGFIILFSPNPSNTKELLEIKNFETTLISLEKDKNDILNFQFLKAFKCPSCLLYCNSDKKYINKYCVECSMYICTDCNKGKKHTNHYLIDIDRNNIKDSIKLWNINLNAELSEQIRNFNKQINFITDDLNIKIKIWIDNFYKRLKSFEVMINNIKIKAQELQYYFKESEEILNKAMANLTKSEQEINVEFFNNEKSTYNLSKFTSLEDVEIHLKKLKNNYTEISNTKKNVYNILNEETIKKWEEMIINAPMVFEGMFKATDLIMEDFNIYEMKSRKNSKKETSQGRRKKPDLYLNGNILFKTSNEAQIGLIRKKSKNIYILHDSERKKTDFSIKLKNKANLNEKVEDGNNKIIDYTNRGIQSILERKKSGEYKAFENDIVNNMKYLNRDMNRYTPKNVKLPKIVLNDKDKYNGDIFDRYKEDVKKSFDYNKNSILAKKI